MTYQLREYQKECIESIRDHFNSGATKGICHLCTASGKTVLFSALKKELNLSKRILVLAHRKELLTQAAEKMKAANPECSIAIDQGTNKPNGEDILCSSIPTLGRGENNSRLLTYNPQDYSLVIWDEIHHISEDNSSYLNIYNYFIKHFPEIRMLGFTATVERMDGYDISDLLGPIIYSYPLQRGMQEKYIIDVIKAFKVTTSCDISQVKSAYGDFMIGELSAAINVEDRNNLILKAYKEYAGDRQTLVFCSDVAHTNSVNNLFVSNGIKSEVIIGTTEEEIRKDAIARYMNCDTKVLISRDCLGEGADLVPTSCLIMGRPTKSSLVMTQQIGRGLRLCESKKDLLILDICDIVGRVPIQTATSILGGLHPAFDCAGGDIHTVSERVHRIQKLNPNCDISNCKSLKEIEIKLQEIVDLFNFEIDADVNMLSNYRWIKLPDSSYALPIEKSFMQIKQTDFGVYKIYHDKIPINNQEYSFHNSFKIGDKWVREHYHDNLPLIKNKASWHDRSISQPQLRILKSFNIPQEKINSLNRKEASQLISKLIIERRFLNMRYGRNY